MEWAKGEHTPSSPSSSASPTSSSPSSSSVLNLTFLPTVLFPEDSQPSDVSEILESPSKLRHRRHQSFSDSPSPRMTRIKSRRLSTSIDSSPTKRAKANVPVTVIRTTARPHPTRKAPLPPTLRNIRESESSASVDQLPVSWSHQYKSSRTAIAGAEASPPALRHSQPILQVEASSPTTSRMTPTVQVQSKASGSLISSHRLKRIDSDPISTSSSDFSDSMYIPHLPLDSLEFLGGEDGDEEEWVVEEVFEDLEKEPKNRKDEHRKTLGKKELLKTFKGNLLNLLSGRSGQELLQEMTPATSHSPSSSIRIRKGNRRKTLWAGNSSIKPNPSPSDTTRSVGSILVSAPLQTRHKLHVTFDYEWQGDDPVSQFEILQQVGHGAHGTVYKGRHKDTGFILAIKCIPLKSKSRSPTVGAIEPEKKKEEIDTEAAEKIEEARREIRLLKECKHENIVCYYGCCCVRNEKGDELWVLMEYCHCAAVNDVMKVVCEYAEQTGEGKGGKGLKEEDIAYILLKVVQGLEYIHSMGIVHRDLKSGNILLTQNGDVKIADFGMAKEAFKAESAAAKPPEMERPSNADLRKFKTTDGTAWKTLKLVQASVGTPLFTAPEVLSKSQPYTAKADIWAVGVMAIQLAEGKPPLVDEHPMRAMLKICTGPPMYRHELKRETDGSTKWSPEFVDFVENHCLKREVDQRPTAKELLEHPWLKKAKESGRDLRELIAGYWVKKKVEERAFIDLNSAASGEVATGSPSNFQGSGSGSGGSEEVTGATHTTPTEGTLRRRKRERRESKKKEIKEKKKESQVSLIDIESEEDLRALISNSPHVVSLSLSPRNSPRGSPRHPSRHAARSNPQERTKGRITEEEKRAKTEIRRGNEKDKGRVKRDSRGRKVDEKRHESKWKKEWIDEHKKRLEVEVEAMMYRKHNERLKKEVALLKERIRELEQERRK